MAIERRDVLFYLSEVQRAIIEERELFGNDVPKDVKAYHFNVAWTSRNLSAVTGEDATAVRTAVHEYSVREPVVIFVCSKQGMLGAPKDKTFIVPEKILKEVLIKYCSRQNIMLPKAGRKSLIIDNLMIGIRIDISDQLLSLED